MSSLMTVKSGSAYIGDGSVVRGDLERLLTRIDQLTKSGAAHLVVTANIDHIIDLHRHTELESAYQHASLRTIDGTPVLWLYRLLGAKDLHRHTGADLLEETAAASHRFNWTIAVTGGEESTLAAAATNLRLRYPQARVFAVPMPMLTTVDDAASGSTIQALTALKPDLVFVCLGAPKQESWFLQWKGELPPAVYIGAGAAVEFAAGTKRRAPRFAQRLGFEWAWRLGQEFRRLAPRYLVKGPQFVAIAFTTFMEQRRPEPRPQLR